MTEARGSVQEYTIPVTALNVKQSPQHERDPPSAARGDCGQSGKQFPARCLLHMSRTPRPLRESVRGRPTGGWPIRHFANGWNPPARPYAIRSSLGYPKRLGRPHTFSGLTGEPAYRQCTFDSMRRTADVETFVARFITWVGLGEFGVSTFVHHFRTEFDYVNVVPIACFFRIALFAIIHVKSVSRFGGPDNISCIGTAV